VGVQTAEDRYCIEVWHLLELALLYLKLEVVVDLFLNQSTEFELDIRL
jgi:hypothetical protein